MNLQVRPEVRSDLEAVRQVNQAAFPSFAEADLVDRIRNTEPTAISLVAEYEGAIAGHILFSPVTLQEGQSESLMGLAPMSVQPELQYKGIGKALVEQGLLLCKQKEVAAIFVLGHPNYYPKFGFRPAQEFSIKSEYEVPSDAFMALELFPKSLELIHGTVKYCQAFSEL